MKISVPMRASVVCLFVWSAFCLAPAIAQTPQAATAPAAQSVGPPAPAAGASASAPAATPPPQPAPAKPSDDTVLTGIQQTLTQLQNQAPTTANDARLATMEAEAAAAQAQARAIVAARAAQLAPINKALGLILPKGHRLKTETPAQKAKAAPMLAQRASLTPGLQAAQAVAAQAASVYDDIAQRRRESFSTRVLQQSASPLFPSFWTSLLDSAGADVERLGDFAGQVADTASDADEPKGVIGLIVGLLLGGALLLPIRHWLERFGRRKSGESVHPGFARTGAALWIIIVDTATPTLAAVALRSGAQWGGLLSDGAAALADAFVVAIAWGAAILALGRVLATDPDPSQRLLPLSEATGQRIRWPLLAVAVVNATGLLFNRLNFLIGASVSATVAVDCAIAIAYAMVASLILATFGGGRNPLAVIAEEAAPPPDPADEASPLWTAISLGLAIAIAVTLAAVLFGYTTLAQLTSSQIFWLSVIAASVYVLLRFIDDACGALFGPKGWAGRTLIAIFNLRRSTVKQVGLLVAAALEILVVVGAASLALTPFGQGGTTLFGRMGQFGHGFQVGSVTLSPRAIGAGLGTLVVGMALVRTLRRWLVRRYLPATDWDAGLRNSVETGVGYLGAGVALICALAAMGLGFQQIALIASALSVGIGFGLQQVVQNFVSGVILLIERPVKVGDWINVSGVDGDVRRIRVRATEIQTFDRATVIVPNSDLITKQVVNNTRSGHARLELALSIANPADAERASAMIIETAKAHPKVLGEPAPAVYITALAAAGAVNFSAYIYVASRRDAMTVRSKLYFDLLARFQAENIPFMGAGGPANVIVDPGPEMQALVRATATRNGAAEET